MGEALCVDGYFKVVIIVFEDFCVVDCSIFREVEFEFAGSWCRSFLSPYFLYGVVESSPVACGLWRRLGVEWYS